MYLLSGGQLILNLRGHLSLRWPFKIPFGSNRVPFRHHNVRCGTCQVRHVPHLALRGQALAVPVHSSCTTCPGSCTLCTSSCTVWTRSCTICSPSCTILPSSCKTCTLIMYHPDGALYHLYLLHVRCGMGHV